MFPQSMSFRHPHPLVPAKPALPELSILGPNSPASLLLFYILDDCTLGESQLILSLRLVVKEGFDCTLQSEKPHVRAQQLLTLGLAGRYTYVQLLPLSGALDRAITTAL